MAVGKQRWTARAEELRATDPPTRRLLPQNDEGEGSPPLVSYLEHPWVSSALRALGWMFPRAHEPTKALVPASPREGQRVSESRDAFYPQESDGRKIALLATWTGTLHYAAARLYIGWHCNRRYRRLWYQLWMPDSDEASRQK
jgi:hypothetical protein